MLKKKLKSGSSLKKQVLPSKFLKKKQVVEDEEDLTDEEAEGIEDSEEADDSEDEEEAPKHKKVLASKRRAVVEEEEDEEDEEEEPVQKKKPSLLKKGKTSSLAKAFDNVPISNNADDVPAGRHEAIIDSVVLQPPNAKGQQSVRWNFKLCSPDFAEANSIADWRMIFSDVEDGIVQEVGTRILKGELAKLGYEVNFDDLEECFEQITEEKPGVLVKVFYQSKDGNEYQHVNILGELPEDNEVLQAYKDNVPY